MIIRKFDFATHDFYHKTVMLAGVKGSGKSSFALQYLYTQITSDINIPYQRVYVNIDGFSPKKFDALASLHNKNIDFYWLDVDKLFKFAYTERKLYREANQLTGDKEQGNIAKYVRDNLDDHLVSFLDSLFIIDEADAYLTKKDDDFANYLKFSRHYNQEIWLLTQKFQNIHNSYYNANAINNYLLIRNPVFNYFGQRYIEFWSATDTTNDDNLLDTQRFKIDSKIFDLYDSGANIGQKDKTGKSVKYSLIALFLGLWVSYMVYNNFVSKVNVSNVNKDSLPRIHNINIDVNNTVNDIHIIKKNEVLLKCIGFGTYYNCYYKNMFTTLHKDYMSRA